MPRCGGFKFDPQISDGLTGIAWITALEYLDKRKTGVADEAEIAQIVMEAVIDVRGMLPHLIKVGVADMADEVYEALMKLRDANLMMLEPAGHA